MRGWEGVGGDPQIYCFALDDVTAPSWKLIADVELSALENQLIGEQICEGGSV